MANRTVYPYGTGGQLPASIGIINDLTTGGADKALSAQMGVTLEDEINQAVALPIDYSLYTKFKKVINSSNVWETNNNYQTVFVRLAAGKRYIVRANEDSNVIAVLHSLGDLTGTPDFATGFTGRISVAAGTEYKFTAPADALYCYIIYSSNNVVRDTEFIDIEETGPAGRLIQGEVPIQYDELAIGAIDYEDGTFLEAPTLYRTNYIDIEGVRQIRYARCAGTTLSSQAGVVFFNSNRSYQFGQQILLGQPVNHTYQDTVINIPAAVKYVRFVLWVDNAEEFYAYDELGNSLAGRISSLEKVSTPFSGLKLVANGDSIMYGSGVDERAMVFPMILARQLGMEAVNYAIGGTTAARNSSDYDGVYLDYDEWLAAVAGGLVDTTKKYLVKDNINVPVRPYHIYTFTGGVWTAGSDDSVAVGRTPLVDRIEEMDADADVVLICVGSNDWAYMWTGYGDDSSRAATDFCGAMHLICQQLLDAYPDKLILFITPPFSWRYQPSGVSRATWNMTTWDAVSPAGKSWWDYLATMKDILKQYGIPLLDLGAEMGFSQYDTWWCADTGGSHVHPNKDAEPLIANLLARKLAEYMKL